MNHKVKRTIACLAAVIMLICAVPMADLVGVELSVSASAANSIKSGKCGKNLKWTLDSKGTLTISGTGEMDVYWGGDSPFYEMKDTDIMNDVIIEYGVTNISDYTFDHLDIKSVEIPNSVTSIGECAFCGCQNLTSVVIPGSVRRIGFEAFFDCGNLKSVTFCDGIPAIGPESFCASGLTEVFIPSSVKNIYYNAFLDCPDLKDVYYAGTKEQWKQIDIGIRNDDLTNATIHYNYGATSHTHTYTSEITTSATCTVAGTTTYTCTCGDTYTETTPTTGHTDENKDRFCDSCGEKIRNIIDIDNCGADGDIVTYVLYDDGKLVISGSGAICAEAFYGRSDLTSVIIQDGVTSIGNSAFGDCENITSVTISDGVTNIGDNAFKYCSNLESVTISDSVTSVGYCAFAFCSSLTNVTIGDNVTSIADWAFDGTALYNNKANWENDVLYIGKYLIEAKSTISGDYTVKDGTKHIADNAFEWCGRLTGITIPNSVISIGGHAFEWCEKLTSVTIPDGVTSIGNHAFSACDNLKDIYYTGSQKQWNNIAVGEDNNYLLKAVKHFNSSNFSTHKYTSKVTTPATCTATGTKTFTCTCGASYTEKISQTGHSFGAWKTTKKATYTAKGTQTRTCSKCNKKETKSIAQLATTAIAKCTFSVKSAAYTGKTLTPVVTVKNGKTILKADTHYKVTYKNNTKIGKATATIIGIKAGGYTGTKTLTFNIIPANVKNLKGTPTASSIKLSWTKVAGAAGYRIFKYDTANKKWVKVADTKATSYTISGLKPGTNYKYAVKAYAKSGNTTYWSAASTQLATATKPATPTLKATAGTKQATLSWNKISGATGYEIWMATKKDGSYTNVATVKSGSTVKYTKKSLKTGSTYYFKVRAYKTVDGKNIYGAYSAVQSVKAK